MRPMVRLLSDDLIRQILDEARGLLGTLGVEVQNPQAARLLAEHGARTDGPSRVFFPPDLIDGALTTAPHGFALHDAAGAKTHEFGGRRTYFTPGSAALNILDYPSGAVRRPTTADYIRYVRLVERLPHIAAQSTAFIPADVPDGISDSWRLYLSLLHGTKPVVTGAFTVEAFEVMRDLQVIVRGGEGALKEKPLTIFSCCPTSPLKWSRVTSQNVIDCARAGIPVEFIAMPMSGFVAPVTLVGSLIQHTAETLSGIVLHQCARPEAPFLYGGSPAAFDVRYETTPMGAVETMMIDAGYNEIGKFLGFPTQAYTALSDAKALDAQAGMETAFGAMLAVLSGIDSVSGPGMLDFESCQSLEKLVLDNEICGLCLRLGRGIEPREDFPALPRFQELLRDDHLLISPHTRKHLREEHYFPGPVIDRANLSRWREEGSRSLWERAHAEVEKHASIPVPSPLSPEALRALKERMQAEARRYGTGRLPDHTG